MEPLSPFTPDELITKLVSHKGGSAWDRASRFMQCTFPVWCSASFLAVQYQGLHIQTRYIKLQFEGKDILFPYDGVGEFLNILPLLILSQKSKIKEKPHFSPMNQIFSVAEEEKKLSLGQFVSFEVSTLTGTESIFKTVKLEKYCIAFP